VRVCCKRLRKNEYEDGVELRSSDEQIA